MSSHNIIPLAMRALHRETQVWHVLELMELMMEEYWWPPHESYECNDYQVVLSDYCQFVSLAVDVAGE
jgi:hypothetical protein